MVEGRPHLPQPGKLVAGQHGEPLPTIDHPKPEGPQPNNGPQPDADPQEPGVCRILDRDAISAITPQFAEPEKEDLLHSNAITDREKFIEPAGVAIAGLVAVGTLSTVIWAFNKWKNRGQNKMEWEVKSKNERRHVREWMIFEE